MEKKGTMALKENKAKHKKSVEQDREEKKIKKQEKLPKEISQEILKRIFRCLLKAIGIMIYFVILNIAYEKMRYERLIEDIKVFSGFFLLISIILLEKMYKKERGDFAVEAIEFLILSLHSLSIIHITTMLKYEFQYYLLTSSYIFSIYFVLKAIVLYTKGRRDYFKELSDISEIVKEEPQKKRAMKKKDREQYENKIKNQRNRENKKNRGKYKKHKT